MKNLKSRLIMFVLLVGLVFSGYKIVDYFYTSYDEKQNFNNVEKLVESEYEDEKIQYNDFEILKKYKKVYEKNNDLVGWIKIKDTNIDYPVMQTKDDYSYYLKRNFNKKSSIYGTLFVGDGVALIPILIMWLFMVIIWRMELCLQIWISIKTRSFMKVIKKCSLIRWRKRGHTRLCMLLLRKWIRRILLNIMKK